MTARDVMLRYIVTSYVNISKDFRSRDKPKLTDLTLYNVKYNVKVSHNVFNDTRYCRYCTRSHVLLIYSSSVFMFNYNE